MYCCLAVNELNIFSNLNLKLIKLIFVAFVTRNVGNIKIFSILYVSYFQAKSAAFLSHWFRKNALFEIYKPLKLPLFGYKVSLLEIH